MKQECHKNREEGRPLRSLAVRATGLPFAFLLAGCGTTGPDLLAVELTVSAGVVSPSEPIQVVITATNLSADAIDVSSHGCPQVFEVVRPGQPGAVGPESVFCLLIALPPTRLAPGEAITFRYEWAGLAAGLENRVLPAGEYLLRGWALVRSGDRVFSDYQSVQVAP